MPGYIYNTTVSTKRLQEIEGSYKQVLQEYLTNVEGLKMPVSEQQQMLGTPGAFYKTYHFICDIDNDIAIGDRIVENGDEYQVKEVQENKVGGYPENWHKRILMILSQ